MREQSNPAGTRGSVEWKMTFGFCCACAENAPKPSTVKKAPARQNSEASKTRRLRNPPLPRLRRAGADCEVEFFFMMRRLMSPILRCNLLRINTFYSQIIHSDLSRLFIVGK